METQTNTHVLALAMCLRGPSPTRNGIASIAVHLGDPQGNTLQARSWRLAPLTPNQSWENDIFRKLDAGDRRPQIPVDHVLNELRNLLLIPGVYVVSENVARDSAFLTAYFDLMNLRPVTFFMHDASSYARGALRLPFTCQGIDDETVRSRFPQMKQVPARFGNGQEEGGDRGVAALLYLNHVALVGHLATLG